MSRPPRTIEMTVSLPPIKSAILLDGQGDGGQVKLEVPRSDAPALLQLAQWAGQTFRARFELDDASDDEHPIGRRQAKKRIAAGDSGLQ